MAAYYPDKPSEQQKTEMKHFMTIFGNFFPCDYCAEDFREKQVFIICFFKLAFHVRVLSNPYTVMP